MLCGRAQCRTRFPYAQFLYCLACLSMAAWTWIRFSYCWEILPFPDYITRPNNLEGRYARISGRCEDVDPEPGSNGERFVFLLVPYAYAVQANRYYESGDHTTTFAIIPRGARCREGEMVALTGRVLADENSTDYPNIVAARLDATASRFHPASVSGLVVAVMGCFIFGLYLRTWLGDRKALARQPGQDMIA